MSSNTPANPGWIRAIPRPAGPATDVESNSASEREQQQQQQQARQQPHSSPSNSSTAGFASSFSAFFPRPGGPGAGQASEPDLGEYPLYSSRRGARPAASANTASTSPPFGFSPPSPYAASSSQALPSSTAIPPPVSAMPLAGPSSLTLPYASTARLRRPSVLATSSLLPDPDEDEDSEGVSHGRYSRPGDPNGSSPSGSRMTSVSVDGQDEANSMTMGDDIDMDGFDAGATTSGVTAGGPSTASGMSGARTAAIAIPGRARSHSQSSSVMASSAHLARSPSAWPNSPPRTGFTPSANPQHLLARLTSEQQQAMVASANSASSAYYMIPTPYRQAMAAGNGDDLLLGDLNEQAIDDADLIEEEENDMLSSKPSTSSSRKQSSGMSRSFNPLNPYSERPPSGQKRDATREDSMNMDESPQLSPANRSGTAQALRSPPQNPSLNSLQQSSLSLLRASKSSPALADMNASPQTSPFPASKGDGSSDTYGIPFPSSNPPTPTTPPHQQTHQPGRSNHSGLRRSQSASHRPAELLSIMRQRESSSMQSDTPPLTAPPVSNVFRYQRANSLSDFSRLQRQAGFNMEPIDTLQSSRTDSSSSAMDMATQSVDQSKDRQPSGSSGSDSPNGGPRVVRRAVSHKKGSLLVSTNSQTHKRVKKVEVDNVPDPTAAKVKRPS